MKKRTTKEILRAYKKKGYFLDERPFAMNIFGIRTNNTNSGQFDDILGYLYKDGDGKWHSVQSAGTTDTGTYWLNNIWSGQKGSAILSEGQYKNAYQLGTHYSYTAFVQTGGKVTIYRDYNRDSILDYDNATKESGFFGINLHRAKSSGKTEYIEKYSAGCQVWQDVNDFNDALEFGKKHKERYENKFTYTLFDERNDFRRGLRYILIGSGVALAVGGLAYFYSDKIKLFGKGKILK